MRLTPEPFRELFAEFLAVAREPFAPSRRPFAFRDAGYAERSQVRRMLGSAERSFAVAALCGWEADLLEQKGELVQAAKRRRLARALVTEA
jgi:hypothetical protein